MLYHPRSCMLHCMQHLTHSCSHSCIHHLTHSATHCMHHLTHSCSHPCTVYTSLDTLSHLLHVYHLTNSATHCMHHLTNLAICRMYHLSYSATHCMQLQLTSDHLFVVLLRYLTCCPLWLPISLTLKYKTDSERASLDPQ